MSCQFVGEAVGRLRDDRLGAIQGEAVQHLREAGALVDTIDPADGLVVILSDNGEAP
jgi:hypothetical protein